MASVSPPLSVLRFLSLDFVAALGFPGEGPLCLVSRVSYFSWILVVLACSVGSSHGVVAPRNAGNTQRQGISLENLLEHHHVSIDELNKQLV